MTASTWDLSPTDLHHLAEVALAEPECDDPLCSDGIHWADTIDPETGACDERGYCPWDAA